MSGHVIVVNNLFSFEVAVALILINPFHAMYYVIFDTEQYEDNSNFVFLLGASISG